MMNKLKDLRRARALKKKYEDEGGRGNGDGMVKEVRAKRLG